MAYTPRTLDYYIDLESEIALAAPRDTEETWRKIAELIAGADTADSCIQVYAALMGIAAELRALNEEGIMTYR